MRVMWCVDGAVELAGAILLIPQRAHRSFEMVLISTLQQTCRVGKMHPVLQMTAARAHRE